jgi:hypothetical protein
MYVVFIVLSACVVGVFATNSCKSANETASTAFDESSCADYEQCASDRCGCLGGTFVSADCDSPSVLACDDAVACHRQFVECLLTVAAVSHADPLQPCYHWAQNFHAEYSVASTDALWSQGCVLTGCRILEVAGVPDGCDLENATCFVQSTQPPPGTDPAPGPSPPVPPPPSDSTPATATPSSPNTAPPDEPEVTAGTTSVIEGVLRIRGTRFSVLVDDLDSSRLLADAARVDLADFLDILRVFVLVRKMEVPKGLLAVTFAVMDGAPIDPTAAVAKLRNSANGTWIYHVQALYSEVSTEDLIIDSCDATVSVEATEPDDTIREADAPNAAASFHPLVMSMFAGVYALSMW